MGREDGEVRRAWLRADLVPVLCLLAAVLWSLGSVLAELRERWEGDPRYAHGYLVPLFAAALLWMRRDRLAGRDRRPSAWGFALVALGAGVQLLGGYFRQGPIEASSLLLYLAGAATLWGGRAALAWAWVPIAFLAFMIPLPWRLENAMGPPLQASATRASVFGLQTLGFAAMSEGNVIHLNEAKIGVVEACSGLSMLMTFVALSTAVALVVNRPLVDRVALVVSSIPVAWVANVARITLTGVLHETVGGGAADHFYHDLAGWVMIPFALVLYGLEVRLLSGLLVEEKEAALTAGLVPSDRRTPPKASAARA